jgi:hypothetical protein
VSLTYCAPNGGLLGLLPGLGWLEKENIIVGQIEQILKVEYELPSESDRALFAVEFEKFAQWADEQGLRSLPACGHVAAAYLLDLLFGGESLDEIAASVAAIKFAHEMARQYLDWAPISAALDFCDQENVMAGGHLVNINALAPELNTSRRRPR